MVGCKRLQTFFSFFSVARTTLSRLWRAMKKKIDDHLNNQDDEPVEVEFEAVSLLTNKNNNSSNKRTTTMTTINHQNDKKNYDNNNKKDNTINQRMTSRMMATTTTTMMTTKTATRAIEATKTATTTGIGH